MGISFTEAVATLLKGDSLTWSKFDDQEGGTITLETPGKRRLFKFLLEQNSATLKVPSDVAFKGLLEAWELTADPASEVQPNAPADAFDSWRLAKIEASGFGGLTSYGGKNFELAVGGQNWCLEGQNGSGKSSLANAILWTMTGKRFREKNGVVEDSGIREVVLSDAGKEIGKWPPLASYPFKIIDLASEAKVWVRLIFNNNNGDEAVAYRETISPVSGSPTTTKQIDPRLITVPELLETGLLMPARIPTIGFGDKSQSLYEAVKQLTGLDHLSDIAEAARLIKHGAQPFLKYAKNNGIEAQANKFKDGIDKATKNWEAVGIDIASVKVLGRKDLGKTLKTLSGEASAKAAAHIGTIKDEIATGLETEKTEVRAKVKKAILDAQGIVSHGAKSSAVFAAWNALGKANDDPLMKSLLDALAAATADLETALNWNKRQAQDQRLRLKALAAQYYVADKDGGICPLCYAKLVTIEQTALKDELEELKNYADTAERKLADACASIEKRLNANIPQELSSHIIILSKMNPKDAYASEVRRLFTSQEPFKSTLVGIAKRSEESAASQLSALPEFSWPEAPEAAADTPSFAKEVLTQVSNIARVHGLILWWSTHGARFREAWRKFAVEKDAGENYVAGTIGAQIEHLQQAIDKADPADRFAQNLADAAEASDAWDKIQEHQRLRQTIADNLQDLKDLGHLVGAETASSISVLSGRIKEILGKIHLRERLEFAEAALEKKTINVEGSFEPGMRIEAALVANTSWLRAILWAFVLALREQTIARLNANPFPLMVFDDPQVTFDPRNKRKWAEMIATIANRNVADKYSSQLILTTHEQQFFKYLINVYKLSCQQGLIAGVNKVNPVVSIANGYSLQRAYDAAIIQNDDKLAHQFISDTRIYCEDLLKCIMRAEGNGIADMNLTSLNKNLKALSDAHIPPFDRDPFATLREMIGGGGGAPINHINASHHQYDGTIGVAQARDVKAYWDKKLQVKIHQCFEASAQYDAFGSDPRIYSWDDTVLPFPDGHKDTVKTWIMKNTGIAAAAKTDGRAGDGNVTLTEWEQAEPIKLFNHEIFQLAVSTLEPVAAPGDMLIVCNHAEVTGHSLVVASHIGQLLARRYNLSDLHPDVVVLTAQTLEPHATPQPVIATKEKLTSRKVVATLFTSHLGSIPPVNPDAEVVAIKDTSCVEKLLQDARLFKVDGRSAEPIALDGQFLITHPATFGAPTLNRLDGRLVVAVDDTGARYFKRLRVHKTLAVLESLNPDGTTHAELLSLDGSLGFPQLAGLLEVVGILFELPADGSEKKEKK